MTNEKIIEILKTSAWNKFGSSNCYAIQQETGLSWKQIQNILNPESKIAFKSVLKYAKCVGVDLIAKIKF